MTLLPLLASTFLILSTPSFDWRGRTLHVPMGSAIPLRVSMESSSTPKNTTRKKVVKQRTKKKVMRKKVGASSPASQNAGRVIEVTVQNWKFGPKEIRVKKGERVRIHLRGLSGAHGFSVPQLGIDVPIAEGGSADIELPTDAAGTFTFLCSIPCGPGHPTMRGTIIIQ